MSVAHTFFVFLLVTFIPLLSRVLPPPLPGMFFWTVGGFFTIFFCTIDVTQFLVRIYTCVVGSCDVLSMCSSEDVLYCVRMLHFVLYCFLTLLQWYYWAISVWIFKKQQVPWSFSRVLLTLLPLRLCLVLVWCPQTSDNVCFQFPLTVAQGLLFLWWYKTDNLRVHLVCSMQSNYSNFMGSS